MKGSGAEAPVSAFLLRRRPVREKPPVDQLKTHGPGPENTNRELPPVLSNLAPLELEPVTLGSALTGGLVEVVERRDGLSFVVP